VLAFVGRLAQVKRPDRLLEVVRHVAAQIPDVTLLVVGEGPLYARTIEAARDLGDTVRFLGWRADVERIYAAADIVVLTSDNEGMPVGLIEASMCSRPCVTTDVGSAGEVVLDGRTGRVTSTDPHDLARAVLNLAMDAGQRGSYGEAGRRHAQRKFGASRLIADVDAAYRELLRGSRLLRGTRG
jgi:glycosyltransferase involved in cell wall biosynthesis